MNITELNLYIQLVSEIITVVHFPIMWNFKLKIYYFALLSVGPNIRA